MKLPLVTLSFIALAHAQTRDDIPSCALPCLDDAVQNETNCGSTDYVCICDPANVSAIESDATNCVLEHCGIGTAQNKVVPAVKALCIAQGNRTASSSGSTSSGSATSTMSSTTTDASGNSASTTSGSPDSTGAAATDGYVGGLAMLGFAIVAL